METTIFDDAVKAYAKFCKKHGYLFCEPDENMSIVGHRYIHLVNINGKLGKYDIATNRIITNKRKLA